MKKTVGIITFHASHNYGSMLQAFALQKVVNDLGFDSEIINLRTDIQKKLYLPAHKKGNSFITKIARFIFVVPFKNGLNKKYKLYEEFIKNSYKISPKEYSSLKELQENILTYDFYITGSDQVWNTSCTDFNWAYYLPFVKHGKKIAYAPSMGQRATKEFNKNEKKQIKEYLTSFDSVSVREDDTAKIIEEIVDIAPQITLDPTLLLNQSFWDSKISSTPIIEGDYIFYYNPRYNSSALEIARKLSKTRNIKVVTSIIHSSKFVIFYPDFKKELAVGPWEFLNLCKNAKLVCGNSYHLLIFALVFNTPFFSADGMKKNRIRHLLQLTNLSDRSISKDNFNEKVKNAFNINFSDVNSLLKEKKEESLNFLKSALEID